MLKRTVRIVTTVLGSIEAYINLSKTRTFSELLAYYRAADVNWLWKLGSYLRGRRGR
jgi:hypothetical protein